MAVVTIGDCMNVIDSTEPGYHNTHWDHTRGRLVVGGSWKRQRIVGIMPSSDLIHAQVALAWRNLMFPPNQPVTWQVALGEEVGKAYSDLVESILMHPDLGTWEYLLTIESDNLPPPDGVFRLLARMEERPDLHAISGLYYTKGHLGQPQIWGDPNDAVLNFRPQIPVPEQLVECCGIGMGFSLFRMEMFKDARIPRPLFKTKASLAEGVGTQDLAFWTAARPLGYRCAVDCAVKVGHLDYNAKTKEVMVW